MQDTSPKQWESMLAQQRRARDRAILVAIAACTLAFGIIIGVIFSATKRPAIASLGEVSVEMSSAFVEIARRVEPSVVNISTVSQPALRSRREIIIEERPSLEPFSARERARRGNGSGVIVDAAGYILTNQHVIADADRIIVKFFDGNELPARVIGSDMETDLAVIKVEPAKELQAARTGDSERARVGDWVMAIGSPFNLSQTVTAGIISAKDREATELNKRAGRGFQYFLQTDAAINPGNSGGPLINLMGEVIGINTAIATTTGDYNGIGFALPMSEALLIYHQLIKNGHVVRGFLGVNTEPVTPQIAKVFNLPATRGAIVSNIGDTVFVDRQPVVSPAAKAGLLVNDVIWEFRGERIRDDKDLMRRIGTTPVGTTAPVKIYRNGREQILNITIGRRPDAEPIVDQLKAARIELLRPQSLGITVSDLRNQMGIGKLTSEVKGVFVGNVAPGSLADDAGLKSGDVIEMFNREPIKSKAEYAKIFDRLRAGEAVVLQIYRDREEPNPRFYISFTKP
ncbi:MAG: trypsin-like peptidase domain-containing protein [Acidobacteria bacterium]|nr:trypsin-like peptidase domain-containing protein [Acidobacteriota bacterium]MBI3427883.1 trypsin-like peptidase domain-containing protein [Acidobacteriota bacterium]